MSYLKDIFRRLRIAWGWVLGQFVGMALLILIGVAWTRLPEKHIWQVAFGLLLPILLVISVLELQAATMRKLADNDGRRVKLVWGALTLLVWIALGWAAWWLLDWCDDQIPQWAGYLNSKASTNARSTVFTYAHISLWLGYVEWVVRWIVIPGKIIPYAMASAQWGWRLPWGRPLRVLFSWRWWPAVVVGSFVAVWLPSRFFNTLPNGTVSAQVWHVSLKLAGAYLLCVSCWVLLLMWAAVIFATQPQPDEYAIDQDLFRRLRESRRWIAALLAWTVLSLLTDVLLAMLPSDLGSNGWVVAPLVSVLLISALLLGAGAMRSLMGREERRVRPIWGALSVLAWAVPVVGIALLLSFWHQPVAKWLVGWIVMPILFVPFAGASAVWGLRLPWRRILRLLMNWRWWLVVIWWVMLSIALPALITAALSDGATAPHGWAHWFEDGINDLLFTGGSVILLGLLAVLFGRQLRPPFEDALVAVPVLSGPPQDRKKAEAEIPPHAEDDEV